MPFTIAAIDPSSGAHGLLVEVHPELSIVPPDVIERFCRRLFERSVRVGLVITPEQTVVVRGRLTSRQYSQNGVDTSTLETKRLLQKAGVGAPTFGEDLVQQVRTWLTAVGSSWYSYLHDDAVAAMVPDVVGHLVGADLEVWNGLLEKYDAAE